MDFLKAANTVTGKNLFEAKLVGLSSSAVTCAHGVKITPESAIRDFDYDVLIIPGFWAWSVESVRRGVAANKNLQEFLDRVPKKKSLYSYCTGSVFHASTQRLSKKSATASWWLAQELVGAFPKVQWQFNQISAGDVSDMTAAGANGFYPLYSHLVSQTVGSKAFAEIQKYLMTPVQFNANNPFYELESLTGRERLDQIRRFVEKTAVRDIRLSAVAESLGISTKTLSRKLREDVNWTPARFFRMIKLKQAGALLTSTEKSVKEICDKLGFDDEAQFRKAFKRCVGLTPGEYKRKFQIRRV
ncbi:AraC family transcriptional regulator [Bdellovibrio bacteriovorus str. Tiberius]|uniref:AraC family transcriptional regulator n=1 Tax=Bdellovibrio bacteriovorus str. Tiberius TaxID=1069642 RepID=K7ZBL3_BDEBC|nr:AraC family transcriptional regulator [Bdellovibrio bacteriovorus str. Tiberius]